MIAFGRDGKPFYIQGPYDADRVLRTLGRTAGRDNHHFLVGADATWVWPRPHRTLSPGTEGARLDRIRRDSAWTSAVCSSA